MDVLVVFLCAIVWVVLKIVAGSKKGKKTKEPFNYGSSHQNQYSAAAKRVKNAADAGRKNMASRAEAMKHRATHADDNYDDRMLDFCDSTLPDTRGITFRGLPEGTDELLYLRRYNRQREKDLERALMRRESEIIQQS